MAKKRSPITSDLTQRLLASSQKLSLKQKQALASEFSFWVDEFVNLEHGAKFTFKDRPYLVQPFQDDSRHQVHKKATQLGLSTFSILKSIHSCTYRFPLGVIYFFPTDADVSDFSRGRVSPLIKHNPDTIGMAMTEADTDTVGLKQVGKSFIYFRGMKSKVGMKSVPADMVVFDELDEAPPEGVTMARKRLSASSFQEEIDLSNPTIPGYGIDLEFQASDQKFYMLKCPHCGEWNCLEESFPDCLLKIGDEVILACIKCRRELDKHAGQWVAKFPSKKDVSGYQYSQLFSPTVRPKEIWDDFVRAQQRGKLALFYNLTIGLAYVTAKEKLVAEQVLKHCSPMFPANPWSMREPVFMGVDQGNYLHIVFMCRRGTTVFIWFAIEKSFEDLDRHMNKGVTACVIDGMPETRKAKEFAARFPGRVFLNYYNANMKGAARWIEDGEHEDWRVEENRTESLDASHLLLEGNDYVLPARNEQAEEFAMHCANVAKKLDEDIETGSKRYIWVRLNADHYRHAANYSYIAMSQHQPIVDTHSAAEDVKAAPDRETAHQDW